VIGGRVLDSSAIVAFCSGTSVYAAALVWTAVEEGMVLLVPSTAVAEAWARLVDKDHEVLEVLLRLPVTIVDELTTARARAIGARGGNQIDAHALVCAHDRGWPLLTADSSRYIEVDLGDVEIEQLP
jgi:predicted nucleic acid-binding protein